MTDPIPPDGIVAARTLFPKSQARLRDALLSLHDRREGADALNHFLQAESLAPVTIDMKAVLRRAAAWARAV